MTYVENEWIKLLTPFSEMKVAFSWWYSIFCFVVPIYRIVTALAFCLAFNKAYRKVLLKTGRQLFDCRTSNMVTPLNT